MLAIVVYDIADDRRRTKLATFLEGYGRRVQESVFECFVSLEEMAKLHRLVKGKVKSNVDNVRFYWVSVDAVERTLTIGSPKPKQPPQYYIV
jgi:CRISPR-associated protein Cas2